MVRSLVRSLLLMLVIAPAASLYAQRVEGPSPLRGDTAVRTVPAERSFLESIVFDAEPRSFQVVRVPIPAVVRNASNVSYEIEPSAAFTVIGHRRGMLTGGAHADLLVTVRVPADARAGSHMAAHAVFRFGNREVAVPIETRVKPLYRIKLHVEPTVDGVQIGERLELRAAVANLGNATDTIRMGFELPMQWNAHVRDTIVVVAQGEVAYKLMRVTIPKSSGSGSFFIRTTAASRAGSSSAMTTVSVGSSSAYIAPPGPTARIALGGVGAQDGGSAAIAQIALSGPLTNAIQIDTRIATQPTTHPGGVRGLARVGAYVTEPHLSLWTSTWRAGFGSTVANFNDVMGVNAGGRGIGFDYDDQKRVVSVRAARPVAMGAEEAAGYIFGADYSRRMGPAVFGGGVTRMRGNLGVQSLDAAGIRAQTRHRDMLVEGALAYRDFTGGNGIGWIAGISGNLPKTRGQLRIVHAPGGTDAFARAETELVATAQTRLDERIDILTTFFRTDDTDATHNQVQSHVASITPSYRLNERTALRAEMRATSFEVDGHPFAFTNSELHFGLGGSTARDGINYSTDIGLDRLTRGVRTPDLNAEDTGARLSWRATASKPFSAGVIQLDALYERNQRSTGFVPEQMSLVMRGDRLQLSRLSTNLTIDGEVGFSRWSGIRSFATFRAGANYLLPSATEISAALERNPLMYSAGTHTPVVLAFRVEKSFGLPRMNVGRAAGVVFQDYNGNGRRDADEPGMPNIRVRRGTVHATTDSEGRYRFWEEGRGATVVDAATLPFGWIVNERIQDGNIALVPTTRVEVLVQLGAAERLRNIDVSLLQVTARDDSGRVWIARRTAREIAVFEALPVGMYELGIDAAGLAEPLRIEGAAPRVNVTRESVTRVNLPVAGRPLRFKQQ